MDENIQNENIRIDLSENNAFNYAKYRIIIERLKEEANREIEEGTNGKPKPMSEVINALISDIINQDKEGYTRKINTFSLGRLTPGIVKSLLEYLRMKKKKYEKEEQEEKKQKKAEQIEEKCKEVENDVDEAVLSGEQGSEAEILEGLISAVEAKTSKYDLDKDERKEVLKRLKNRLDKVNKEAAEMEERRRQEEAKRKAKEAAAEEKRRQEEAAAQEKRKQEAARKNAEAVMNQIQERSEREYKLGRVESRLEVLNKIRDALTGEGIDLGEEMGELSQEHLLEILDDKIKDELYYEQVKAYTNNFEFLRDYPEFVKADHGARERKKFTDFEAHSRFCDLASALEEISYDENTGIQQMLSNKNINEIDRRILTERREALQKQMERKRQQEEGTR